MTHRNLKLHTIYFTDEDWGKLRDLAYADNRMGPAAYICKKLLGYSDDALRKHGRRMGRKNESGR